MKYLLPILLFLVALNTDARADVFATPQAAKASIDKAMELIVANDIDGGFSQLKAYAVVPPAEFDAFLGQAKFQMSPLASRFGKTIGHEFIKEDKVGNSFIRLTYLLRYEKHATRWFYILYNNGTGWMLNAFYFNDRVQDLFPN